MTGKILNDSTYQSNMAKLRQGMRSAGGYSKAADEIERYMHVSLVVNY